MANDNKPIDFSFDTSGFEKAMKNMNQGLQNFGNTGKSIAKGISNGFAKVVGGIAKIGIAIKAVKGIMAQIPEVGQAFGIAKDIIMKNLLFPLRKQLFPILQKMLDWVRDNRAQFVKWGRVLANVFGSVVGLVESLINTGKRLMNNFMGFIGRIFGAPVQDLEKTINLLTFKLSVALNFLGNLIDAAFIQLEPLFSVIGEGVEVVLSAITGIVDALFSMTDEGNNIMTIFDSILETVTGIAGFIVKIVDGFLQGFIPKINEMIDPIQSIVDNIGKVIEVLFTGEKALAFWSDAFTAIGNIIGTVLVGGFEIIAGVIDVITEGITAIVDFFENFDPGKFFSDIGKGFEDFFGGVGDFFSGGNGQTRKVNDAILRPDGTIIETAPEDTLIATKTPENLGGGRLLNLYFGDINISIPPGQINQETAVNLAADFIDQIRNRIDSELVREGI